MKTLLADSFAEALFVLITLELSYSGPKKYVLIEVREMEMDNTIVLLNSIVSPTKTLKIGCIYKSSFGDNNTLKSTINYLVPQLVVHQ